MTEDVVCVTTGLGGAGLGSPLLGSMFSGLVPTTSSSVTISSPATVKRSSPASSTTSHADRCDQAAAARLYASPSSTPARRSKTSTPVQKVKNESRLNRDADSSPCRSSGRRDSLSSTSSADRLEHAAGTSTAAVKSQSDCPSLESSLLSAEAAMYASSPLFFPFALPHLFSSSSAALPFPGLLPPSSTSTSSVLDAGYTPPSLLPLSEDRVRSGEDRARSNGSSSKASTSSPSGARPARSSRHGERPESRGGRGGRSVIVSPTSSVTSDPDVPPAPVNSSEWKPRDVVNTWSPSHLNSTVHHSPPLKVRPAFISPITSSSSDSPLCSSITPSLFHSRLKTYLFHKSYPRSFTSSSWAAFTHYCSDLFYSFLFLVLSLFFVSVTCARLSWPSHHLLSLSLIHI